MTTDTHLAMDLEQLALDAQQQAENQAARFSLDDIVAKGDELEQLHAELEVLTRQANDKGKQIHTLETETLPDMLKALGLKDLTMTSGAKISLYDILSTSITDDNRDEAHDWLRKHGHGDIIKNTVTVTFGKGEDEEATTLVEGLLDSRYKGEIRFGEIVQKEVVHPQTLKAFTKEQLARGTEFPGETFKLYTGQAVKFKK